MKITWFAHAAFLIEGETKSGQFSRIITDPYKPDVIGFLPITEPADIVVRSSADDTGHCFAEMITGNPIVVTATEIDSAGAHVRGVHIMAIPTQESLIHKDDPGDNAMYRFTLDDVQVAHFGDVGNRLTEDQLAGLAGADVLLVPTGGPPTIDLDDLCAAIDVLQPRLVIPMHYHVGRTKIKMFPVTEFIARFSPDVVRWADSSDIVVTRENLPDKMMIVVLTPSTGG